MTDWKSYEEVSRYLIERFKSEFDLQSVEGKQLLVGKKSGTEWEVDGKGITENGDGFVIIEARRYTTSKQNQEQLGGIAYRIQDTGAKGGIIVSPLGLQEGAKKVAAAENIVSTRISADSTPEQFAIEIFGNMIIGAGTARLTLKTYPPAAKVEKNAKQAYADESQCPPSSQLNHKNGRQ